MLRNAYLTEAGERALSGLSHLKTLSLQGSSISGLDGLQPGSWRELEELNLAATLLSDRGLGRLVDLPKLKRLHLSHTQLALLSESRFDLMPELEELDLSGTQVEGEVLVRLASLKKLKSLDLSSTKRTDAGLERIAALTALRDLELPAVHSRTRAWTDSRISGAPYES